MTEQFWIFEAPEGLHGWCVRSIDRLVNGTFPKPVAVEVAKALNEGKNISLTLLPLTAAKTGG